MLTKLLNKLYGRPVHQVRDQESEVLEIKYEEHKAPVFVYCTLQETCWARIRGPWFVRFGSDYKYNVAWSLEAEEVLRDIDGASQAEFTMEGTVYDVDPLQWQMLVGERIGINIRRNRKFVADNTGTL